MCIRAPVLQVIAPGKVAQDMVLLEGEAVVDETVLTGEKRGVP